MEKSSQQQQQLDFSSKSNTPPTNNEENLISSFNNHSFTTTTATNVLFSKNNNNIGGDNFVMEDTTTTNNNKITITVKYLDDPNLILQVDQEDTIQSLKNKILLEKSKVNHQIRLICNGRLLKDSASTIRESKILNNSVFICSITEPLPPLNSTINNNNPNNTILSLNNSNRSLPLYTVSDDIDNQQLLPSSPLSQQQRFINPNLPPLFQIRSPIVPSSPTNASTGAAATTPSTTTTTTTMDYTFVNRQVDAVPSVARDSIELIVGMSVGFFLGPISLLFLSKSYITRNFKVGILMGVLLSLLLGLARLNHQSKNGKS